MGEGARPALYAPLILCPRFSRCLAFYLLCIHGLALAALFPLPLPVPVHLGGVLLILTSLGHSALLHLFRRVPWAIREAIWDGMGVWRLRFHSGQQVTAQLLPQSWVSLRLVVLTFRLGPWRRHALVLPTDTLPPELLRQLRVRLKLDHGNTDPSAGTGCM